MADEEGPQAPPAAQRAQDPLVPQNPPSPQNPQIPPVPQVPHAAQVPQVPQQPAPHAPLLNWSHSKPKFSGKPEKDTKAHLLRTNDWMDMHKFQDNVKVQRFCLTLTGEARLWYKSLRPINIDWLGCKTSLGNNTLRIGNTREQLFHTQRSFHFNENAETMDTYVPCIRQVAIFLGYQEPQILEVFKNTLPTKLYWVLFQIMDLRQAVKTAKRMLTKEKIDRQLVGQTFSTPFMNIKEGYIKKVTFDMMDSTEQKIGKLIVMMGKLVTEDEGQNWQFKPQVYHSNRCRGQTRHNYEQRRFQDRYMSNNTEEDQGMDKITEVGQDIDSNFRGS